MQSGFLKLLLDIGDGVFSCRTDYELYLPESLGNFVNSIDYLVNNLNPQLHDLQDKSSDCFRQRAILFTKNYTKESINNLFLDKYSSETVTNTHIIYNEC